MSAPSSIAAAAESSSLQADDRRGLVRKLTIRVLMTADTVGGVWNYSINLTKALAPYGVEVVLATMGRFPSADQRHQAETLPNLHLADSDFKLEWMENPWADVNRAGDWLLKLEARWRPALIHLNGYSHAALPWNAPKLVIAHSCVLSWWDAVRRGPLPSHLMTYAARVAEGLRSADIVIAPTGTMLAELRRLYSWQGDGLVIWNGLPSVTLDLNSKEEFILTVGRLWDEAKNLNALESIAEQLPWPVYAAGEGGGEPQAASVRRLGHLPAAEISRWMARASIYALPARYEPFGLSILEAALSGCALVVGNIPSLRELWDEAAWFVGPDDPQELRHSLTTLVGDLTVREKLAKRARQRARQYGLGRMAQQYLGVYRELLEGSGAICV